jgi:trehalose 6-phosphate phosphatase
MHLIPHAPDAYIPAITMPCMSADPARLPPPPPPAHDWALFLDVDGTLLDFAPSPDGVHVPADLIDDLRRLHDAFGGALALVSGRRLETLDALFAPLRLPAIGLHGLQRRDGAFAGHEAPHGIASVLAAARALAAKYPGVIVEDKGITIALHWRNAPAAEEPLHEFASSALIELPGYCLQPGHDVLELRPDGHDKGDAIIALLQSEEFRNRFPVFIGDDLTDEHGFDAVNARHGISVLVGTRANSAARHGLHDPGAVRTWLREAARLLAPEAVQ